MASAQEQADLVSCSSKCDWPILSVERPPREQQGPHWQSKTTHSHHTPSSGSSCPIFTHSTLTMRGTKADNRKYGKLPEILLLSGYLSDFMEAIWTWDSLLKLLHDCPSDCCKQITNLLAETNWPGEYVGHYFYRGATGRVCVFHMLELRKNLSAPGEEAQCTLTAAPITEFGSDASSVTEHPHFLPCASLGWHRAPDESRDLGETSPGRNK